VKRETSPDSRSQNASAAEPLQEAREMPPGAQRSDALKKAGLLRRVADSSHGLIFARQAPEVIGVKGNCHYLGSTPPL
jgi:hypothetical protein